MFRFKLDKIERNGNDKILNEIEKISRANNMETDLGYEDSDEDMSNSEDSEFKNENSELRKKGLVI